MSTFDTTNIESTSGGTPDFSQGLTVGGTDISSLVAMTEYYDQASEPGSPANGAVWWDGTKMRQYIGSQWITVSVSPPPTNFGQIGVFASGAQSTSVYTNMYRVNISTNGNATSFGQITQARQSHAPASSGTSGRGVFAGGSTSASVDPLSSTVNTMDYITIGTTGNATDFGDLSIARDLLGGCSDAIRGVFGGGYATANQNVIDYITIATTSNSTDFGDLTASKRSVEACADSTYGVFGGGYTTTQINVMEYITIQTLGNAIDFGDLTSAKYGSAATANSTRGIFFGGRTGSTVLGDIDYITIATPGNATDFGDLFGYDLYNSGACNNGTRALCGGGSYGTGTTQGTDAIRVITMETPGNASTFGTLGLASRGVSAVSGD